MNWRELEVGTEVVFDAEDWDGFTHLNATVTEVNEERALAISPEGFKLWIDDDTSYQFKLRYTK